MLVDWRKKIYRYFPTGTLAIETGGRLAEDQQTVLLHNLHRKAMPCADED